LKERKKGPTSSLRWFFGEKENYLKKRYGKKLGSGL